MTQNDLREIPGFRAAWVQVWPHLEKFLIARALNHARSAKCVIETAQAETARQKELALLISDLAAVALPAPEPVTPKMPPLNSMREEE